MISKMMPAVALVALMLASGCTIRTGEAANDPHHHNHRKSPPPPPPKKRAEPKRAEVERADVKEVQVKDPAPSRLDRADPKPAPLRSEEAIAAAVGPGWEKLGEATANGKNDHDVITIGRAEGKFNTLRFYVKGSNVKMQDVVVHFANGEKFSPTTRVEFREGSVSSAIDLPGAKRTIKSVNFKYSDSSGSGNGTVEVWGK